MRVSFHLALTMYMRPYWRCHVRFCIYWTIVYLAPAYYVWGLCFPVDLAPLSRPLLAFCGSALRFWGLDMDMESHAALFDISQRSVCYIFTDAALYADCSDLWLNLDMVSPHALKAHLY